MGYSTEFAGELKFTSELSAAELAKLNTVLSSLAENGQGEPE